MPAAQRIEEALVIGLGSYLVWKFLIGALLALHLLNSYIYFGKNPFWNYVNATAQTLLSPLEKIPLRAGKVDFAPVVGIALVFFIAELAARVLALFLRATVVLRNQVRFRLWKFCNDRGARAFFRLRWQARRRAIRRAVWRWPVPSPNPCCSCILRSNCI